MGLLGDLETATAPRVKPCKAKIVLDALSPKERALADSLTSSALAPILGRNGHHIGVSALHRHRTGGCPCSSTT